jgi:hypothetical protein
VSRAFAALKEGDALLINETLYRAAGKITLKTPDGCMWDEWFLCPKFSIPKDSIKNLSFKWLAKDQEIGLSLWSPTDQSAAPSGGEIKSGQTLVFAGNTYRASEVDEARVIYCLGDVGGECVVGDKFFYADMRASGSQLLSIEWNQLGHEVMLGRRVPDAEILKWAKAAGNDLIGRMSQTSYKAKPASSTGSGQESGLGVFGWIMGIAVFCFAVLLESCDGEDNCYQRINPATNQYETVCDNGVRGRNGRGSTGWGGK